MKSFEFLAENKKTPKSDKSQKKRKADTPKSQPSKKKPKTEKTDRKQSTLFDHFKKSKEPKAEKPEKEISIAEKMLLIVESAKTLSRDENEYWGVVKKIVSAISMNTAKYREKLFEGMIFEDFYLLILILEKYDLLKIRLSR